MPPAVDQHARMIRVGEVLAHLQLARHRIDHRQGAGDARVVDIAAAAELAAHMGGRIRRDVGAAFVAGDVEEPGAGAVGVRPEIGAAMDVRAGVLDHVGVALPVVRIGLHVLAGVVVDRLAALGIDALGPGHLGAVLHRLEELAVEAIDGVVEAVAVGMHDELAVLAVDLAVDDDLRAAGIVVAVVVGGVLEVPRHLAGRGIDGDGALGEQIVARTVGGIVARGRIAGAPIGEIGLRIVGAGDVERAAAGAPGFGLVLPGLAAGLARRRHHEGLPFACRRSWDRCRRASRAPRCRRRRRRSGSNP